MNEFFWAFPLGIVFGLGGAVFAAWFFVGRKEKP
jgi:hypothetical protein